MVTVATEDSRKLALEDPEAIALTEAAAHSLDLQRSLEVLTADTVDVRGCMVNPERGHLQALQNVLSWTIGGFDTRPVAAAAEQKHKDRLQILLSYRQPMDAGSPPVVRMYDYLCDTLFGIPMQPVGPDVVVPEFLDLEGKVVKGSWVADFRQIESRPSPVFATNRYPYQLPERPGEALHPLQRTAQHWILWYFHFPGEQVPDFPDEQIDEDVRREVLATVRSHGFRRCDYIWYRNPAASVPEMFHVQVFWIVPELAE